MKKRLRKKKHKGEFAVFGRQMVVRRNTKEDFGGFLDRFIEIVESQACFCGGGGKEDTLDVIVELGRRDQNPEGRMDAIQRAVQQLESVESIVVGEEFDLWYSEPKELAT